MNLSGGNMMPKNHFGWPEWVALVVGTLLSPPKRLLELNAHERMKTSTRKIVILYAGYCLFDRLILHLSGQCSC